MVYSNSGIFRAEKNSYSKYPYRFNFVDKYDHENFSKSLYVAYGTSRDASIDQSTENGSV